MFRSNWCVVLLDLLDLIFSIYWIWSTGFDLLIKSISIRLFSILSIWNPITSRWCFFVREGENNKKKLENFISFRISKKEKKSSARERKKKKSKQTKKNRKYFFFEILRSREKFFFWLGRSRNVRSAERSAERSAVFRLIHYCRFSERTTQWESEFVDQTTHSAELKTTTESNSTNLVEVCVLFVYFFFFLNFSCVGSVHRRWISF